VNCDEKAQNGSELTAKMDVIGIGCIGSNNELASSRLAAVHSDVKARTAPR